MKWIEIILTVGIIAFGIGIITFLLIIMRKYEDKIWDWILKDDEDDDDYYGD